MNSFRSRPHRCFIPAKWARKLGPAALAGVTTLASASARGEVDVAPQATRNPSAVSSPSQQDPPAEPSPERFELKYTPGVPIEVATRAQKRVAVKQYRMGIDLIGAGKAQEALELFRMSYEKVASPNSRLMMARALMRLERHLAAHRELLAVIEEAERLALGDDKYANTVQAAKKELELVEQRVAIIRLQQDGVLLLNGTRVAPSEDSQWVVMPGTHEFVFRLSNGQQVSQTVVAEAGQTHEVRLEMPAPKVPAPAPRAEPVVVTEASTDGVSRTTLAIASASVALVGAAGFVTFGLLDRAQYRQLERDCPEQRCAADLRGAIESGRTYQTLANVGLGVGAVGLVGAAYFFLTRGSDEAPQREGPQIGIGPKQVHVFGRF